MLTADRHIFNDESYINVSNNLIAIEADSNDLICLNDTVE